MEPRWVVGNRRGVGWGRVGGAAGGGGAPPAAAAGGAAAGQGRALLPAPARGGRGRLRVGRRRHELPRRNVVAGHVHL